MLGKTHEIFFTPEMYEALNREGVRIIGKVVAIVENKKTQSRFIIHGVNIVTDKGDTYYAQMACSETPTNDFDGASSGLRLGSSAIAPAKSDNDVTTFLAGTGHGLDATYEKTADSDPDNTGAGVDIVTWRFSYLTTEGNATGIQEGAIVDDIVTPTGALCHFLFAAAFDKTSSDTLKVFGNHTFNGV